MEKTMELDKILLALAAIFSTIVSLYVASNTRKSDEKKLNIEQEKVEEENKVKRDNAESESIVKLTESTTNVVNMYRSLMSDFQAQTTAYKESLARVGDELKSVNEKYVLVLEQNKELIKQNEELKQQNREILEQNYKLECKIEELTHSIQTMNGKEGV